MHIQWYPGHMTKTKRMILENISLVDIVIELLDARVPMSSKNPDIDTFAKGKHRIVVLNKSDLSDPVLNQKWKAYFEKRGATVILANSVAGKGLNDIWLASQALMKEKIERQRLRGRIFVPIRAMIVGIPNVGKSTLINKCVGKSITETGNRPGVTRSKQWVKIKKDFELLDTPGILWPKFEDQSVGLKLAFTGAIKDDILDTYTLGVRLVEQLMKTPQAQLKERYKIDFEDDATGFDVLELIGQARGLKVKGGTIDCEKAAVVVLDDLRSCRLGKLTLESPEEYEIS